MKQYQYDAVLIGSGNSGLTIATRMDKFRIKVLLLEQHNVPGGFSSSFVRGIFEFEPALHELKGIEIKIIKVYKMFEELQVNKLIEWIKVNELFTVVLKENKKLNYIVFHLKKRICFKNGIVWKR